MRGGEELTIVGTGSKATTLYDYEVPPGVAPRYRARVTDVVAAGEVYASPWTTSAAAPTLPQDQCWLKDPYHPVLNRVVRITPPKFSRPQRRQITYGIGSDVAAVSHDGRRGVEGPVTFRSTSKAEDLALNALFASGRTLLLQDTLGRQWYLQFGDLGMDMKVTSPGDGSAVGYMHDLTLPAVEVGKP
jgi:hypothetical protein